LILSPSLLPLLPLLATLKKVALFIESTKQSAKKHMMLFLTLAKTWVGSLRLKKSFKLQCEKKKRKLKQLPSKMFLLISKLWTGFSPNAVWNKWKLNSAKPWYTMRPPSSEPYTPISLRCGQQYNKNKAQQEESKSKPKGSANGRNNS